MFKSDFWVSGCLVRSVQLDRPRTPLKCLSAKAAGSACRGKAVLQPQPSGSLLQGINLSVDCLVS